MVINPNCQALCVGAGPVGLFCSIQAKLQDPSFSIALFDRYGDYVRTQNLNIDPSSFNNICDLKRIKKAYPEYAEQVNAFAQLIFDIKSQKRIKINILENRLRQIAEGLQIPIYTGYTFKPQATDQPQATDLIGIEGLKTAFPNAKVIIGSDGAHSKIREAFFGNEMKVDESLQYTIAVRYWVKNESRQLGKTIAYPTQKVVGVTQEHVGKYDEVKRATPVTLQCFVGKETFDKLQAYKAGNPLDLSALGQQDAELEKKIKTWLGVRHDYLGDIVERDIQVYTIKLPVYASKQAVVKKEDLTFCLLGDALIGVPFYQSINVGLQCASKLSKTLVKATNPSAIPKKQASLIKWTKKIVKNIFAFFKTSKKVPSPFDHYTVYVDQLGTKAIRSAKIKNFFLNVYQWYVDISSRVPWQLNRWKAYNIRHFTEIELRRVVN